MAKELKKVKSVFAKCQKDSKMCDFEPKKSGKYLDNKSRGGIAITPEKYIELMDKNWGWCENPANPYNKIKSIYASNAFNETCPWTDDFITRNFLA